MYIVGFNGPPRSGKDTAAEMLHAYMIERGINPDKIREDSLSLPLRHIAYGMCGWRYGDSSAPDYEEFKNMHFDEFGKSGRKLMIDASESFLKPNYGQDIMAKILLRRHFMFDGVLLIKGMGFQCEFQTLAAWESTRNVYIVRVQREGTTFEGDSREWVNHHDSGCSMALPNNRSLDDLRVEAGRIYGRLVNQMGWVL